MKLLLTALASSALAIVAAGDASGTALTGSNMPKYGGDMPNTGRVMAGGVSSPKPLDDDAKEVWEQTKQLKSSKLPDNYLSTLADPVYVQTQVVAGINYVFTFQNGMQVTVNSTPWRQDQPLTIVDVDRVQQKVTTAAKPDNVAGMQLTQSQRERAVQEFNKQDVNKDGSIPNGAAYSALMNLEGNQDQSQRKCPGWEEVTQDIVGSSPGQNVRIDDFMNKYTDFEVARRSMNYFSKYAGDDCVLTGAELETGIRETFGSGVTKDQTKQIIQKYGQDKDPNVSFSEFYNMYKDYEDSLSDQPNHGNGDVAADGTLTEEETNLAEKGWNALDTSKDGLVQNSEFSAKFETIIQRMQTEGDASSKLTGQLKAYFEYFAGKDGELSHVEYLQMMEVMKHKAGTDTFEKFLDALTSSNCGELSDCYTCVSADLSCAWMPAERSDRYDTKDNGACIESQTAQLLSAQLLRGAPASQPGLTSQTQCGMKYDPQPHVYDGIDIMPPVTRGMPPVTRGPLLGGR